MIHSILSLKDQQMSHPSCFILVLPNEWGEVEENRELIDNFDFLVGQSMIGPKLEPLQ